MKNLFPGLQSVFQGKKSGEIFFCPGEIGTFPGMKSKTSVESLYEIPFMPRAIWTAHLNFNLSGLERILFCFKLDLNPSKCSFSQPFEISFSQ